MEKIIPEFLLKKIQKYYSEEDLKKIVEGLKSERKVTLRVNTLKTTKENVLKVLNEAKIEFSEVLWNTDAIIIEKVNEDEIRNLDIYIKGEIYLQSLSSMIPAVILNPNERENILDMCAAPGGKTSQIATICNNKVLITACEKNKIRADRLKYNLDKQGVKCANIMVTDSRNLSDYFSFDKILLDAPCSGSGTDGVFHKDFSEELIKRSVKLQEALLKKAIKLVKSGSEIVYSTCSILKEENEEILKKLENQIEIVPIDEKIKNTLPNLPSSINGVLTVCPTELYEGFFVAKLRKK